MKKNVFLISLLVVCLAISFIGCNKASDTMIKGGEVYKDMEGWIDDDTYQVKALGFAPEDMTEELQRKYAAKRAAQLNAEARIVEKLVGANVEGKTATEDGVLLSEIIKKDFGGMIKGGAIVLETYDPETQACEIAYQVSAKGLRKKAEAGFPAQ